MADWVVAVGGDRYQGERLYQGDGLEVAVPAGSGVLPGDRVVLTAEDAGAAVVFGLGRVSGVGGGGVVPVVYTHRLLDRPVPADQAGVAEAAKGAAGGAAVPVDAAVVARLVELAGPAVDRVVPQRQWMVSLDLPVEASSPAEAVRVFWSYVRSLGPTELPAFVWPRGDELAMRPYVLGTEHEMDPEEED
jgi:hypothetical protein